MGIKRLIHILCRAGYHLRLLNSFSTKLSYGNIIQCLIYKQQLIVLTQAAVNKLNKILKRVKLHNLRQKNLIRE